MSDDIKVFGLANGMEIVGTFVSEDAEKVTLKSALILNIQQDPQNPQNISVGLIPPTFFSKDGETEGGRKGIDLDLYKANLLFTYELREDIRQRYTLQTGKIMIAGAGTLGALPKR